MAEWSEPTDSGSVTTAFLRAAAYDGASLWVAVGNGGVIATSTDGDSWSEATDSGSTTSETLYEVAHDGAGLWVAVAGDNGVILNSSDGDSWSEATDSGLGSGSAQILHGVAHDGSKWVLVGDGGQIATSTDGDTWTEQSSPTANWWHVSHGVSLWVAVGNGGVIATSTDGDSWSEATDSGSTTSEDLFSVAHDGSKWVAVGRNGTIVTSTDGDLWTEPSDSGTVTTDILLGVDHDGAEWVVVGDNGTILESADGDSWTESADSGTVTTERLWGVTYADGLWVAVGANGTILNGGGTVSVSAQPATIAADAQTPTVNVARIISAQPAATTVAAQAADVPTDGTSIAAQPATLAASAQAPTVSLAALAIAAQPATLDVSAQAATVSLGALAVSAQPASLTSSAQPATANDVVSVQAQPATIATTAQAASPQAGAIAINGQPATLTVTPKVARVVAITATPSGLVGRDIDRVTPTVTDGAVSSVARTAWGRLAVTLSGEGDITYLDGAPIEPQRWSAAQPFGDGPAIVRLPQRDYTDDVVHTWNDRDVEIRLVPADGSANRILWEGYVVSVEDADGGSATELHCQGALYQLDEYVRAPLVIDFDLDVVDFLEAQFSRGNRSHLRLSDLEVEGSPPSVTTRQTGAWDRALSGYIREMLFLLQAPDGTPWTIDLERSRIPRLRAVKDLAATPDVTVEAQWPGVEPALVRDASETTNVVYGEGTDRAGQVWRNADYTIGIATYDPLAHTDAAHPSGTPDFDASIIRRERHIQFPGGTSFAEGTASAQQVLDRDSDPKWVGRLTLTVDPPEMSRFEIDAGDNLLLKGYRGDDVTLQVAERDVDWRSLAVTLTVDEQRRDVLTIADLLERRREGSTGPVAQLRRGRSSQIAEDTKIPWDDHAGSGYIPRASVNAAAPDTDTPTADPEFFVEVAADQWNIVRVFAAQRAAIRKTTLQLHQADGSTLAAPFWCAFFDGEIAAADLEDVPLEVNHQWESLPDDVREVVGWGSDGQRAGYSPGFESDGDSATGLLDDEAPWQIDLEQGNAALWLAVWPESSGWLQGRLIQGVD